MPIVHPPTDPHYADSRITLHHGDSLAVLPTLDAGSVDAVVTDPPYGLEFMGKEWDGADGFRRSLNPADAGRDNPFGRASRTSPEYRAGQTFGLWSLAWATECLRVLKPGGHLLAFGGTRTWHRLAAAIEDAGFEIRDSIAWMYGSGFPKSLNLVDDGGERTGWGTALKPAFEPIVVARKPLAGTVAANVLTYGTGALNIDGCRVAHACAADLATSLAKNPGRSDAVTSDVYGAGRPQQRVNTDGRWPANVILDESQAAELDQQSGLTHDGTAVRRNLSEGKRATETGFADPRPEADVTYGGIGGASRFFKVAKDAPCGPCEREQHQSCDGWSFWACECDCPKAASFREPRFKYAAKADHSQRVKVDGVAHPTVKPLDLMRWLVRLVTPAGGTVLEPFAGSGTTVEACILEGFKCVAIEREADYLPLIVQRINRKCDPVAAVKASGEDPGLFDLLGEVGA